MILESLINDRNIIIFDLGSVLVDGDFKKALQNDPIIPNEYVDDLINAWIIEDSQFTETCTKEEYIKEVYKKTPDIIKPYIPNVADVNSSYIKPLSYTYDLLNNLRKDGYKLYYLSNWNMWHVKELKENGTFDFLKLFDGGAFSYSCGCMKPDERIYEIFLRKYNIDPLKAVFCDDKEENVLAASKFGIEGIKFDKEAVAKVLSYKSSVEETSIIYESSLSSKERNKLDDDEFGIPSQRKYPLNDKKHVEQAIKMFNHVDESHEKELAENILDAMEKYKISKDSIGDKNRLKKYIKESSIEEGVLWNDNTPKEIKDFQEKISNYLEKNTEKKSLVDSVKDTISDKTIENKEKNIITKALKSVGSSIVSYDIEQQKLNSVEIGRVHEIICAYKDFILNAKFAGTAGKTALVYTSIKYDPKKCKVPKNVALDFLNHLKNNVNSVSYKKNFIKINGVASEIERVYPILYHKYGNKYSVKKNAGGFSITISTLKFMKEGSPVAAALPRQDFQPDAVYIVNYLKKNTFENDIAICKDLMSNIFIYDGDKPKHVSLTDFKGMADSIKMYKYIGSCNAKSIIESSKSSLDFYKNMVKDESVTLESLDNDYRFEEVLPYTNLLESIEECIINSKPHKDSKIYCPIIPMLEASTEYDSVQYYRDINGVFAQNVNTLTRSASYNSIEDIPITTINILKRL